MNHNTGPPNNQILFYIYVAIFGAQLRITEKNSRIYLVTAYYTPNDDLVPTMHRYIRTLWLATLHFAVSFKLLCTLILKLLRGILVLFYKFAAKQQQKKENKLGVKKFSVKILNYK